MSTRNTSTMNAVNELLDKKLVDLATKEGIDEIKLLIKGLNERIDTQSKEISFLNEKSQLSRDKDSSTGRSHRSIIILYFNDKLPS